MKKRMILFFLCFTLSLGGIIVLGNTIYRSRDQVEITETVIYGDPAWAEGVTLTGHYYWPDQLYWDTTYTVGDLKNAQTEFEFCPGGRTEVLTDDVTYFFGEAFPSAGFSASAGLDLETEYFYGFEPIVKELAKEMDPGEQRTKMVNLKDYYEYYPFRYNIQTESWMLTSDNLSYWQAESSEDPWVLAYMERLSQLDDFFRIPIVENSKASITLELDENGNVTEFSSLLGENTQTPFFLGTGSDTAIYVTFETAALAGMFDYSQIPGGLGVYRLPYGEEEEFIPTDESNGYSIPPIYTDQLENIYPLPNDTVILDLGNSADGTQIFLLTVEDELLTLTVLDGETGAFRQKLALLSMEGSSLNRFQVYEDILLFTLWDGRLALATPQPDGSWQQVLVSALPENDVIGEVAGYDPETWSWKARLLLQYDISALLWDGETLTIASPITTAWTEEEQTGVFLSVYDSAGVQYVGRYDSSLGPHADYQVSPDMPGAAVSLFGNTPLALSK